jgi:hypothetical protein
VPSPLEPVPRAAQPKPNVRKTLDTTQIGALVLRDYADIHFAHAKTRRIVSFQVPVLAMAAAVFCPWYPASAKINLMKGKKRRRGPKKRPSPWRPNPHATNHMLKAGVWLRDVQYRATPERISGGRVGAADK